MNFRETAVVTATTSDPGGAYNQPYVVTGLTTGQWLAYTVNVPAGTYHFDARVASATAATGGDISRDPGRIQHERDRYDDGSEHGWADDLSDDLECELRDDCGSALSKFLWTRTEAAGLSAILHWFQLTTVGGTAPTAPTGLAATAVGSSQINLSWTNTASNQTGFEIDRSVNGGSFSLLTNVGNVTTYSDLGLTGSTTYAYRVEATNAFGTSPSSNTSSAVTPANTALTYLSDLTWVSATAGFGTVQKDTTISGNPIKLRGTTYTKGLGAHAASQIVYNLGGQYTNFVSDVGVDDEEIGKGGTVTFQVLGDSGAVLFPTTAVLTPTSGGGAYQYQRGGRAAADVGGWGWRGTESTSTTRTGRGRRCFSFRRHPAD